MIYVESDGICICNNCSKTLKYLIENEKPSYKEPPKEVCFYAYKRINHLREILAQFQAKETTQIPDDVIKNIKSQITKERISLSDITNKKFNFCTGNIYTICCIPNCIGWLFKTLSCLK